MSVTPLPFLHRVKFSWAMWVYSLCGPQARALAPRRPRRPPLPERPGSLTRPGILESAALLRLPAAQSSRLIWPVVLPPRHSFLRPFPPTPCRGRCLGQSRDTHGSVSQIKPARIWLLREGASYSVAIPANRWPEGVQEKQRRRPREK